jgi:hypothetical protein
VRKDKNNPENPVNPVKEIKRHKSFFICSQDKTLCVLCELCERENQILKEIISHRACRDHRDLKQKKWPGAWSPMPAACPLSVK